MRAWYNGLGALVSIILAGLSLCAAYNPSSTFWGLSHENLGKVIVAFWALIPPGFFWLDWVYFCTGMSDADRKIVKHTHDLARNIWIALVGVLAFAFFKISGLN
jgi:hypothetical protein